jgi:hypothetical protein
LRRDTVTILNHEGIISTISIGFFLILAGAIFISTPDLVTKIVAFFNNFTTVRFPNTTDVFLPVPVSLRAHLVLYNAAGEFSLIFGIFQILILILRFVFHSPLHRKAEGVSDIIFWLGISYLISLYLTPQITIVMWFIFWSMVIMLVGMSLIARAIMLAILPR